MNIVISEIRRRLELIVKLIQKLGKSYPTRKEELFSWFTVTKWELVKQSEKDKHSPYHCYQCLSKHSSQLNMLPSSRQLQNSHKRSEIVIQIPKEIPNSSHFPLMDLTNRIYQSISRQLSLKARAFVYKKRSQKFKNKKKEVMLQERLYLTLKRH